MGHTVRNKEQIVRRLNRLRGQLDAVARMVDEERECSDILHMLAACRGAITSLTAEVIEDHIRYHVFKRGRGATQEKAGRELIDIVKTYLK